MEKSKMRRLDALNTLNDWMNIEMSGLRQEQLQADQRLQLLEQRLRDVDDEINEVETRVRAVLDPGTNLVIEEYRMLLTYLDYKQRMRTNSERQRGFAREKLANIEDEMIRQGLKIRGMENLLERKLKEIRRDMENRQFSVLDEAWLLRPGDGQ